MPDDPVNLRILQNIAATLEAELSAPSPDYFTVTRKVAILEGDDLGDLPAPCILILRDSDRLLSQEAPLGADSRELRLTLVLAVKGGDPSWETRLERFVRDVRRALELDYTRGDLAIDTRAGVSSTLFPSTQAFPTAQAEVVCEVNYRHLTADPSVSI